MAPDAKTAVAAQPAPSAQPAPTAPAAKGSLSLPLLVASPSDVGRLQRELETLDGLLHQAELRGGDVKLPKTSALFDQTVTMNKIDLLATADRERLAAFLKKVRDAAPLLHMSFSADPSVAFLERLMAWLRKEIHPLVMVNVGLQPNLGAGCVVRSINKQFDFSLRQDFNNKHEMLLAKMVEGFSAQPMAPAGNVATPVSSPAPVAVTTTASAPQAAPKATTPATASATPVSTSAPTPVATPTAASASPAPATPTTPPSPGAAA